MTLSICVTETQYIVIYTFVGVSVPQKHFNSPINSYFQELSELDGIPINLFNAFKIFGLLLWLLNIFFALETML